MRHTSRAALHGPPHTGHTCTSLACSPAYVPHVPHVPHLCAVCSMCAHTHRCY